MTKPNLDHLSPRACDGNLGAAPHPASDHLLPSAEKGISPERRGSESSPGELAVEPFINKKEVARRMGRTTRGVDKMMRRGLIPYYKFGYAVAFRWSEITSHLAQTCRTLRSATGGKS